MSLYPPYSTKHKTSDLILASLIFAATLALFLATTDMGFTRDEGFYFHAGSLYAGWFEDLWANFIGGDLAASFTQENIDSHWSYNREHPVVMKAAFALSHLIFHDTLDWMTPSTAWRFPAMITASALLAGVYLFGTQLAGRIAGFVAVGALLFQPRFFFHAHLACFDVPIAALWFWVIYAYWQSFDSRRWAIAAGVLFGIALSVKLNAFFLPIVLVGHWALMNIRKFGIEKTDDGPSIILPPIPKAFWAMAALGPLLFYALWPRHWFNTFARVRWYMDFHLTHEHYFVRYFGENLQIPPFPVSYPTVMTLVTVPATILSAMAIGALFYFQRCGQLDRFKSTITALRTRRFPPPPKCIDPRATGLLLVINIVFPILLISTPNTPIFGGTKHWMPAMPFAALLAGFGVATLVGALRPILIVYLPKRERLTGMLVSVSLVGAVVIPAALATHHNHPHGTSYYNELIGSHRGAADQEMFRQFWGYSSRHSLPWVNETAPDNTRVWTHNTIGTAWRTYIAEDLARSDLRASSMRRSDIALYHQQKAFVYQLLPLWEEYGTMAPAYVVAIDDVPLLSVYMRSDREDLKYPDVWR